MAFQSIIKEYYQCLSTDTKLTTGVKPGAKCEELDTGKKFVFDGNTWNLDWSMSFIARSFANVINAPLVGAKTVGTVAASLFAGASRLASRVFMKVVNVGTLPVYYGPEGVTTLTGIPIQPGEAESFAVGDLPIYFVAAANNEVRVEER
ncbi:MULTISPECIES: hypothetical protein [Dehalobacter]|uniref:hypothetical protein n=1 Tax=Dehalobacter TaxID=56112 RepID=UPI00258C7C46|nr:hypothetical protein [Dehalobacter sp.]MDJ0305400.1 hypothetical protein [Dehalobacter sp.]